MKYRIRLAKKCGAKSPSGRSCTRSKSHNEDGYRSDLHWDDEYCWYDG